MTGRRVLLGSTGLAALLSLLWAVHVLLASDARDVSVIAGAVAGLLGGTGIFLAAAAGSPRLGALAAAAPALLLTLKPYVKPLWYRGHDGTRSTFSAAAETHLYFLVPGFLLGVLALGAAFVPVADTDRTSRAEVRFFFRVIGGVTGLFAALGLLLSFTNSRGTLDMVLLGLVPSGVMGVASIASLVRGSVEDGAPLSARALLPYRAPADRAQSVSAHTGQTTGALLRALAAAPAPAPAHLPSGIVELPGGTRVGGFVIRGKLGAGGMGVVYRARDERLGRDVALKLLPPHLAADPVRLGRFLREARSAASVLHPNVAAVFELGEGDPPYIAMELVEGEALRARLARGPLPVEAAHRVALEIAGGLAAAHAKGIVHRDLKPENVMLAAAGGSKLVDFGLARLTDGATSTVSATPLLTESGLVVGTPRYMAPEQALGGEVDVRADVYAFGLVLFEMLTGAPIDPTVPAPWRADVARKLAAPVAPGLADVIGGCLAWDPAQRHESGAALVAALTAAERRGARVA